MLGAPVFAQAMKHLLFALSATGLLASLVSCGSQPPTSPGSGGSGDPGSGGGGPGAGGQVGNTGGGPAPSSGGSDPGTGGSSSGGSGGSVGSTGGGTGAGGTGSGGAPVVVDRPPLVTSSVQGYWQVGNWTEATGAPTVTVNDAPQQRWIGFGGTFNEHGWNALQELSQEERDRAMRLLFSRTEGANFAWGRIPIGASDYAMERYTLCDAPCNETNLEETFSIARDLDQTSGLIPYIHAAQAVKPDLKLWGSPWTPPPWMKTPAEFDGTDEGPDGNPPPTFEAYIRNEPAVLEAYALYFALFVEKYAEQNIVIDHIQPQNEPGYDTRYPSCLWATGLLSEFVGDYLVPTFEARSLTTDIWFGTLSNNDTYPNDIMGVQGISQHLVGFGLQWNTANRIPSIKSIKSDLLIMQTEHRCGNYPWETGTFNANQPPNDHAYARESWGYFKEWIGAGVNSYSAWNMVLDTAGKNLDEQRPWPQNALLVVDRDSNELTETPAYYVFRHLSYFVDPEAYVLSTSGGDALAFKNPDNSVVAVVYSETAQLVTVSLGGKTVQAQVPAQGFATFYVEP